MTTNKKGRPKAAQSNLSNVYYADLSAAAQRARLLDALRCAPVTTLEARRNLDVLHPAMRVCELRKDGYQIDTIRIQQETDGGVAHNVAKYVLLPTMAGVSDEC